MAGAIDQRQMVGVGRARLAVVAGEGAEDCPVPRRDGHRPTCTQAVWQGELLAVDPKGISRDISHHYQLLEVSGRATGTGARTDFRPIYCFQVGVGKARTNPTMERATTLVQQENRAQEPRGTFLDFEAQIFEDLRNWSLRHDHFQNGLVEKRQSLCDSLMIDLRGWPCGGHGCPAVAAARHRAARLRLCSLSDLSEEVDYLSSVVSMTDFGGN